MSSVAAVTLPTLTPYSASVDSAGRTLLAPLQGLSFDQMVANGVVVLPLPTPSGLRADCLFCLQAKELDMLATQITTVSFSSTLYSQHLHFSSSPPQLSYAPGS